MGPVISSTSLLLSGLRFYESPKITVMFCDAQGRNVVAPGVFVDETTIKCETPSFEQFGAIVWKTAWLC